KLYELVHLARKALMSCHYSRAEKLMKQLHLEALKGKDVKMIELATHTHTHTTLRTKNAQNFTENKRPPSSGSRPSRPAAPDGSMGGGRCSQFRFVSFFVLRAKPPTDRVGKRRAKFLAGRSGVWPGRVDAGAAGISFIRVGTHNFRRVAVRAGRIVSVGMPANL
ncbi:unnamed protein product, partial [marine sediment metagenome]